LHARPIARAEGKEEIDSFGKPFMNNRDPVELAMQEAQRLTAEPVGPNPWKSQPEIETLQSILVHRQEQIPTADPAGQPGLPLAGFDLDKAIHLRWTLRDIKAKRTKLSPVSPDDLRTLIEMGLVEMRDDVPLLTNEGHRAIE